MKKLFVLMVLVVAMVAAPLFADAAIDSWAGDFTYEFGYDTAAQDAVSTDLDLDLTASVGEFTTFDVGVSYAAAANTLDTITMTQDLAGMLGLDFDLTMKVGNFSLDADEYEVIGMSAKDTTDGNAIQFTAGMDAISIDVYAQPVSAMEDDDNKQFGVQAAYSSDVFSGSASFLNTGTADYVQAGVEAVAAGATVDVMFGSDLDSSTNYLVAGLAYEMDALWVGAEMETADLSAIADNAVIVGAVEYTLDAVTPYAQVAYAMSDSDVSVEAGAIFDVDSVSYYVGVCYDSVETYNFSYATEDEVVFNFMMDVDF